MMVQTQPGPPVSPFVEPWQASPRVKAIAAVVTVVVVLLCATTYVVQRIWLTPEAAINGYFGALADRDATTAASYIKDSSTATKELVSAEQYVPPTDVKIDEVEDEERAKVSFRIGDNTLSGEIPLRRKDELTLGLFRGWAIDGGRPTIEISTATPVEIQVNGKPLPAEAGESRFLEVFPGRYVVSVADSPLLESAPVTIDAGFGDHKAALEPRIKASAQAAVDTQVKAYLTACLTEATKPEHNCPFSSDATRPVWKITTFPTIALRLDEDGAVRVDTTSRGEATVTGTGYGGMPISDTSTFQVSGPVIVDQGKFVFKPEPR